MQRTELIGIVNSSPTITETETGIKVCLFNVAVDRTLGDSTDYYRVNAWNTLADNAMQIVEKGSKVFVSGELHPRLYEHQGKTLMSLDLIADSIEPHSIPKTA